MNKSLKRIKVNDFLLAVLLSVNIIIIAINSIIVVDNLIIVINILCCLISVFFNGFKFITIKRNRESIFLIYIIIITFLINMLIYGQNSLYYFQSFLCFGVTSFILIANDVDLTKTFKYVVIFYFICIPFVIKLDFINYPPGNRMGLGYAIVLGILSSVYFIFFEKEKFIKYIASINLITYLFIELLISSRGPMLGLLIFICISVITKLKNKFTILIIGSGIGFYIIYCINNYLVILEKIKSVLKIFNINSSFINHFINLSQKKDLMNGRTELYKLAIEDFLENPIWGVGLGNFRVLHGYQPHNFVLALLSECGILFFIVIMVVLVRRIIALLKNSVLLKHKIILLIIFLLGPFKLLFSSEVWLEQFFWIFLFFNQKQGKI